MKQEQHNENRLDGNTVMRQESGINAMNIIDNINLGMPMMISATNQQEITPVPMDASDGTEQAVPGPSTQPSHEQLSQSQINSKQRGVDEEESSEEEDNSDDECDGDEG